MNPRAEFARIVVPSPIKEALTYRVPAGLESALVPGMRVLVPLGKRKVTGIVLELLHESTVREVKEVSGLQDNRPVLDPSLLQLAQWIAQYYLAPLGQVIGAMLPPAMRAEARRTVVALSAADAASGTERRIFELLQRNSGRLELKRLRDELRRRDLSQALARLQACGAIEIRETVPGSRRRQKEPPHLSGAPGAGRRLTLNAEQQKAFEAIDRRLLGGGFETFLVHGVTGSGKTEIYLRAMERVREQGRQSVILVPEISLAPQLLDRLVARFPERVGVLHSALTAAERWNHWWRIARGEVDVVVGARSAIFAPVPRLGLIVVDEEHDPSYKQEEGLCYNARDVAVVRGKISGCPVVLGSATPAIETYENCRQKRFRLLELTKRIRERPLPRIQIADLRSAGASEPAGPPPEHRLISPQLAGLLESNLRRSKQSLVFLNRRGYANFLQCRSCGYVLRCAHCSVTLTYHQQKNTAHCHHCDFRLPAPDTCPGCGWPTLAGIGAGTEQVEQWLRRLFPEARVERMDRDTTGRRGSHERLIRSWESGEIDILIGTQMITKGHDVTGVTLVAALLADLSLNLPDFRAAERTFQLLSQVAGRAGRGDDPGTVIVQTYAPDHYAIEHLVGHDYKGFFDAELEFRRELNYPPFCRLVQLRLDGPRADAVEAKARELRRQLDDFRRRRPGLRGQIEILGPAPAPIGRLRGRYRWQLLLKGKQPSSVLELAGLAPQVLGSSRSVRLHIDVDPYNML
ncbi:MAG TPA: primosomal protein N' [candidate division Zixibacteria bacterium]|nr:primosomal protein N' [candidate division Zixibacteria bacterium]